MTELPFDLLKANRWFAIECNNKAWDFLEAEERSEEQVEQMLHLAHAARYHWQHAGTEINLLRADVLLATAYSIAKRPQNALIYAESASQLLNTSQELTPFDQASVSGAYALALAVAKNAAEANEMRGKFMHDFSLVKEEEDRNLLEKLFGSSIE